MADGEEARALEHRRMMQAREDNKAALEKRLAGSPEAYRQLYGNTAPLLPDDGWDPERRVVGDESGEEWGGG